MTSMRLYKQQLSTEACVAKARGHCLSGLGTSLIVGVVDSALGLPHVPVSAPLHTQQLLSTVEFCNCTFDVDPLQLY